MSHKVMGAPPSITLECTAEMASVFCYELATSSKDSELCEKSQANFEHTFKLVFVGRGVPKSVIVRSVSISEFFTHDYHKIQGQAGVTP